MNPLRQEELALLIRDWLLKHQADAQLFNGPISEDVDLISDGLVDSMGLVELILYMETITGEKVDLTGADPNDFMTIEGLCKCVLKNGTKVGD